MEPSRSKVQELSIFTAGVGVILIWLTLWMWYVMGREPGRASALALGVPLGVGAVFIVLGALTARTPRPWLIKLTVAAVALGFVVDLLAGFHVVKAVLFVFVIGAILKTGGEALAEVRAAAAGAGEAPAAEPAAGA